MKKLATMSALGALADFESLEDLDGSGKVRLPCFKTLIRFDFMLLLLVLDKCGVCS